VFERKSFLLRVVLERSTSRRITFHVFLVESCAGGGRPLVIFSRDVDAAPPSNQNLSWPWGLNWVPLVIVGGPASGQIESGNRTLMGRSAQFG